MPRPDPRAPKAGQTAMFGPEIDQTIPPGRHSEAMARAIGAAQDAELVAAADEGLLTVLRAGAWALDTFERQNQPYGPSKLLDPLVNALTQAHMTPESRGTDTDANIAALLADLGKADPGPVSHAEESEPSDTRR